MPWGKQSRTARAALLGAGLALGLAAGCAKKEPVVAPEPVQPGQVQVQAFRLVWSTDRDARASVRYGFQRPSGSPPAFSFDHVAYPDAAGRADRAFTREHSVALLGITAGQKVFYQTVNEAAGTPAAYGAPDSFVATVSAPHALLTSTMIHIGFGDSHLLTMPTTGKRFLIDCGYRDAESSVNTYLADHGVTTLDAMMATHVHEDHLGGIVGQSASLTDGLVNDVPPPVFFDSPVKSTDALGKPAYRELLRCIPAATSTLILHRGDSSADTPGLALDSEVNILCLNSGTPPDYVPDGYEGTNINNESIVLRFTYGDVNFIIGGDAESATEASMLAAWPASTLEVEYYKAQHHGLQDANSAAWVNTLKPRVAFIPNTRFVWDPPCDFTGAIGSTESKLTGIGAQVYAIDAAPALDRVRPADCTQSGPQYNVTFATDGQSYEVRLEVARQSVPAVTAQSFSCVQHALQAQAEAARRGF
jgi:hypothetical protein